MKMHYVDIHCHPALKPFSKSFKYPPTKENAIDANRKNSIWHYSPPTKFEKFVNRLLTLTKFTQTDMSTLAKMNTKLVIISLYPFEKHFLTKKIFGLNAMTDLLVNLAASLSKSRIKYVRDLRDYFVDLNDEYQFYLQLHNRVQRIDNVIYTYKLVSNWNEIQDNFNRETEDKKIINVIISIEGGHVFNTGLNIDSNMANENEVLANVKTVKSWEHKPIFLTFAHHFYNELCGHARSISIGLLKKNQNRGLNTDITELGNKVLQLLLDNSRNDRILIDVKHMSTPSRKSYYQLLDSVYSSERIPVIASHGAANGKRSIEEWDKTDFPDRASFFNDIDINFYDDEIIRIAKSNGIFGLQLDERRIGNKKAIKKSKIYFPNKRKQLIKKSLLVWRQIEHIAEVLDNEGLFCWGIQTIGSDFDGIVNPIKGIWTAENIKDLGEELINHAQHYLDEHKDQLNSFNRISARVVIDRVLHENAIEFIKRNY
jgi:microsomal dipeptidase-like Zn-dependent dipeptidase